MATGLVFDIRKFSVHDGPGIRTTVFLKGCPLRCWWCHNPESQSRQPELILRPQRCISCGACVDVCPEDAAPGRAASSCRRCGACVDVCAAEARRMAGRAMTVTEVMADLRQDRPFYDQSGGGVTVSGGEPLEQPDFLRELLSACHDEGFHTAVDTHGHAPWDVVASILPVTDLLLFDVKLMDDERHREYTGVSNRLILENLRRLGHANTAIRIRVPIVPGHTDDAENLRAIATLAASLDNVQGIDLLPYHAMAASKYERLGRPYRLAGLEPPNRDTMQGLRRLLGDCGVPVHIGG